MKERKINLLTVIIITLCLIVGIETVSIFRSVFIIKGENSRLRNEVYNLSEKNNKLVENEKLLNKRLTEYREPKTSPPDVAEGWKVYRFLERGYEVAYPHYYKIKTAEGKDIPEHPEITSRLTLYSDDPKTNIEINAVSIHKYKTVYEYIGGMYQNKIYAKTDIVLGNQKCSLYKMQGEKHYYIILKNRDYIFDINSQSEELLTKVAASFKLI